MKRDIDRFDKSDYAENNVSEMPRKNNKVLGLMKDECKGKVIKEFIGLCSKMYSVLIQGRREPIKKAEGVQSAIVKNKITFDDYKKCLLLTKR